MTSFAIYNLNEYTQDLYLVQYIFSVLYSVLCSTNSTSKEEFALSLKCDIHLNRI